MPTELDSFRPIVKRLLFSIVIFLQEIPYGILMKDFKNFKNFKMITFLHSVKALIRLGIDRQTQSAIIHTRLAIFAVSIPSV